MENQFKGTPGPWLWQDGDKYNNMPILVSESGVEVCDFGNSEQYYPTEGNPPNDYDAKLISKAPEMLESLNEMCEIFERTAVSFQLLKDEVCYKKAKQLIKEATTI